MDGSNKIPFLKTGFSFTIQFILRILFISKPFILLQFEGSMGAMWF